MAQNQKPFGQKLTRQYNAHSMAAKVSDLLANMKAIKYIRAWKESAGPVLLKQAQFMGVQSGEDGLRLTLDVSDPLWRQELEYQKAEILRRFNEALQKAGIGSHELPTQCSLSARTSMPFKSVNAKERRY